MDDLVDNVREWSDGDDDFRHVLFRPMQAQGEVSLRSVSVRLIGQVLVESTLQPLVVEPKDEDLGEQIDEPAEVSGAAAIRCRPRSCRLWSRTSIGKVRVSIAGSCEYASSVRELPCLVAPPSSNG